MIKDKTLIYKSKDCISISRGAREKSSQGCDPFVWAP